MELSSTTALNIPAGSLPSPLPELEASPTYAALLWDPRAEEDRRVHAAAEAIADHWPQLRRVVDEPGLALWTCSSLPPKSIRIGAACAHMVGRAFPSAAPRQSHGSAGSAACGGTGSLDDLTDHVLGRFWGSYVAILRTADQRARAVLRDPSGMLRAYRVAAEGIAVVSDTLPRWLAGALGCPLGVDRTRLAAALAHPPIATFLSLLHGLEFIPAGGLWTSDETGSRMRQAWHPAAFVRAAPASAEEAADRLRAVVEHVCRTFAAGSDKLLIELSGGLDSAILLGAIASGSRPPLLAGVNFSTKYLEGDERHHARAAAELWDVPLVERLASEQALDFAELERIRHPVEPLLYGLDFLIERGVIDTAQAFGAEAILTGQGGDAVFFQMPSRAVAADHMSDLGWRALFSAPAFDACQRTRCSIWRVWAEMLSHRWLRPRHKRTEFDRALLGPLARAELPLELPLHPWMEDMDALPPGKRLQTEMLSNCQMYCGPTFRGTAVGLLHPLLSQPVMERCLAIPTYQLSRGTGDRSLAREAFRDLLPASILHRRSKGEASHYYVRALVESLGFLRPFLLDGTLVAHGFLDADALDALLDETALMWSDQARLPAAYASLEAWARQWGL